MRDGCSVKMFCGGGRCSERLRRSDSRAEGRAEGCRGCGRLCGSGAGRCVSGRVGAGLNWPRNRGRAACMACLEKTDRVVSGKKCCARPSCVERRSNRIMDVSWSGLHGEGRADRVVSGKRVVLGLLEWKKVESNCGSGSEQLAWRRTGGSCCVGEEGCAWSPCVERRLNRTMKA